MDVEPVGVASEAALAFGGFGFEPVDHLVEVVVVVLEIDVERVGELAFVFQASRERVTQLGEVFETRVEDAVLADEVLVGLHVPVDARDGRATRVEPLDE